MLSDFTVSLIDFYPLLKEGVMLGILIISGVGILSIGINFAIRLFKA